MQRHRLVGLVGPHETSELLHRLDELTLGAADLLDCLALHGRCSRLEASQGIGEPLLIVEDARERGLVPQDQSVPDDAHLNADCLLDPAGGVDPLSGLIQEPAVPGHARDRLEAHRGHGNEEQCDQQECPEKLGVNRCVQAGDTPYHDAQGRAGQQEARDRLAAARAFALVCVHARPAGEPAACQQGPRGWVNWTG